MFKVSIRSTCTLSLLAWIMIVGVIAGLAISITGSPAVAAPKAVTCPDNTTGVGDGSWSVVCTGQTAANASISITKATSKDLSLSVDATGVTNTIVAMSASFDDTESTFSVTLGQQGAGNQTVIITVQNASGSPAGVSTLRRHRDRAGRLTDLDL